MKGGVYRMLTFAQSPSKGYKAGLSAVIYRIHSARQ